MEVVEFFVLVICNGVEGDYLKQLPFEQSDQLPQITALNVDNSCLSLREFTSLHLTGIRLDFCHFDLRLIYFKQFSTLKHISLFNCYLESVSSLEACCEAVYVNVVRNYIFDI